MSNPIISGYYADPDIRYFEGRYYIYPTTDGNKWHGASFKCFSSDNLKDWTDHGEIFNITWNSKWAKDFAWAPTVGYKNGKYYLHSNHKDILIDRESMELMRKSGFKFQKGGN